MRAKDFISESVYVIHKITDNGHNTTQVPNVSFKSKKEANDYVTKKAEQTGNRYEVRKNKMGGLKPARVAAAKQVGIKEAESKDSTEIPVENELMIPSMQQTIELDKARVDPSRIKKSKVLRQILMKNKKK